MLQGTNTAVCHSVCPNLNEYVEQNIVKCLIPGESCFMMPYTFSFAVLVTDSLLASVPFELNDKVPSLISV